MLRGWFGGERPLRLDGEHYGLAGAQPGPAPAHPIELWIGGFKSRMLRLTGRLGDGWLPTVGYLDLADAHDSHRVIDEAASRAGRDPGDVRRVLNAGVSGPASSWPASPPTTASIRCWSPCPPRTRSTSSVVWARTPPRPPARRSADKPAGTYVWSMPVSSGAGPSRGSRTSGAVTQRVGQDGPQEAVVSMVRRLGTQPSSPRGCNGHRLTGCGDCLVRLRAHPSNE